MRSFIAATLISAVAANTYTAYTTEVDTIISCGPEVTNCPGSSTVHPTYSSTTCTDEVVATPATYSQGWSKTWATASTDSPAGPKSTESWAKPTESWAKSSETWGAGSYTSATWSAGSWTSKTWESSVTTSPSTEAATKPTLPATYSKTAGAPYPSGSGSVSKPAGSGAASGYAKPTGTGSWTAPTPYTPKSATGAASAVEAAGILAGAGALLAFLI